MKSAAIALVDFTSLGENHQISFPRKIPSPMSEYLYFWRPLQRFGYCCVPETAVFAKKVL